MIHKVPHIFSALSNRSFSFLWIGQSFSMFAFSINTTCLPFLVFHVGGGAAELSIAQTFFIVPQLVFLFISGIYVDRIPKKTILSSVDFLRGIAAAAIAGLLLTHQASTFYVYVLTALLGTFSSFYRPAVRSMLSWIVDDKYRLSANSLRSISQQLSKIIGPVVGSFLVVSVSLFSAYTINAILFALSALLVYFVRPQKREYSNGETGRKKGDFLVDLFAGWSTLIKVPWLGATILLGSLANMGIAGFDVILLPIYAKSVHGIEAFGWFLTSMAVGSLLCALVIGRIDRLAKRGILYYSFMAASGLFVISLAMTPPFWLILVILAAFGFCLSAFIIIWESATQELIDKKLLGRITSIEMFFGLLLLPVSYSLFGWLVDKVVNLSLTIVIAGITIFLFSILGLFNRKIRTLN